MISEKKAGNELHRSFEKQQKSSSDMREASGKVSCDS